MNILLVSRPRTRSTLLINALTQFYNLENKDESYKFCHGKLSNLTIDNSRFEIFSNCIKVSTEENFKQNNFAIKLFPRMLIPNSYEIQLLDFFNLRFINNLSYFTNIRKYDKVYFLTRDIVDSVCSWAYSNYIGTFNFYDNETLQLKKQQIKPIEINLLNDSSLKFYILECAIQNHLNIFLEQNIEYTILNYNDIPDYVKTNLIGYSSKTLDAQLSYCELIRNYSEIEKQIIEYYDLCYNKIKNICFK